MPAQHDAQLEAPAGEKEPAPQALQLEAPAGEKVPAAQPVHVAFEIALVADE